jgi:riboflavin kinase/FMN adenylyltransferase
MGRTIGFPTANLPTHRKKTPVLGVFAVQTHVDGKLIYGVANVGKRPTVDGLNILLEVHLFNFKGDLYGTKLHVELLHKIRDEQKFDSFDLLKQQILNDADVARDYFNKNN